MKVISYSLFKGPDPLAELFYVRGIIFNCWMNKICYPDWLTICYVDEYIGFKYSAILVALEEQFDFRYLVVADSDKTTHCMKMLWRMKIIFDSAVDYAICRDADALTSQREADAVEDWIRFGQSVFMNINDNPGHSLPLMGGMSGYRCADLKQKYGSFENMLSRYDVSKINIHGTDQQFLNEVLYKDFEEELTTFFGKCIVKRDNWLTKNQNTLMDKKDGSDLCTAFIGSAGCNEMETLRYFRSQGVDLSLGGIGQTFPKIFYWL